MVIASSPPRPRRQPGFTFWSGAGRPSVPLHEIALGASLHSGWQVIMMIFNLGSAPTP